MLSGKYVSLKEIIDNLLRDRGYKYELPYADCVEWAVEAMRLIGAPTALIHKQTIVSFENNRAELPIDFDSLIQLAGSFGGSFPFIMLPSAGSFTSQKVDVKFQLSQDLLAGANIDLSTQTPIGQDINGNPVYEIGADNISFPKATSSLTPYGVNSTTYSINNNYIFTNFESGYLFISYKALPIDCDGLPMIPDNQRYIEAVKSFIGMKLDYILWRRGELTERIYRDSESKWFWYVGSAGNAARMPDLNGMQSLLNQIQLVGNRNSYGRFFNTLGR